MISLSLWSFILLASLACSIVLNFYFLRKLEKSEEQVAEECNAKWIAQGRVSDLEKRLEPFKAYEDQVSR